jgi:hypothetical protein
MESIENNYRDKVKGQVGNIAIVAALNIGFAFFESSILIDVVIMLLLGGILYHWNSRISAFLIMIFGCFTTYQLIPNFSDASGLRIMASVWLVWSGLSALYFSTKFHAKNT